MAGDELSPIDEPEPAPLGDLIVMDEAIRSSPSGDREQVFLDGSGEG